MSGAKSKAPKAILLTLPLAVAQEWRYSVTRLSAGVTSLAMSEVSSLKSLLNLVLCFSNAAGQREIWT
jgi:hypothetical protein